MASRSIDKDSKYRGTIMEAVSNDEDHPVNKGIEMQAHHLISAKGITDSGLSDKLESMGYKINALKNLALIPCTLKGACHLGVQLHRGNHTFHDDEHPRSYHKEVIERLIALEQEMDNKCRKNKPIQGLLNKESAKILNMIVKFRLPLTKIFLSFDFDGVHKHVGCSNSDSLPAYDVSSNCVSDRNHFANIPRRSYSLGVGR